MRAYNPGGERTVRFCKAEIVEALANSVEDATSKFKSV